MLSLLPRLWQHQDVYRNGDVLPWWDDRCPLTHDGGDYIRHTVWQKDGTGLLAIGNLGTADSVVTVSAHKPRHWQELYPAGKLLEGNGSSVTLELAQGTCRLVVLVGAELGNR